MAKPSHCYARVARLVATSLIVCVCYFTDDARADWDWPVTAPASWFGGECPNGGWAEKYAAEIFTVPFYCPRSLNDYRATHSHGPMHAMSFLDASNVVYGIHDETGNVFGSSDIVIRKDPGHPSSVMNEDQGFVDTWIYRNPAGLVVRNQHDALHYSSGVPICKGVHDDPRVITNEYKTADHIEDTCAPKALRLTKEPAVANSYTGTPTTYVTWLERDHEKVNASYLTPYEYAWKVYVAAIPHTNLSGQTAEPTYLTGGTYNGGALNRDSSRNAHSPKIALVAGVPWVIWSETYDSTARTTQIKAYENSSWIDKGPYFGTGDSKNCHTTITGPASTNYVKSFGYSVDITAVPTTAGEKAVIVTSNEVNGECRLVVRMFWNGEWKQVGASGGWNPGEASRFTDDGYFQALTPRIVAAASGDVYVVWEEGKTVRISTAHVKNGPSAAWKDLIGPHSGHWGTGEFPSLAVTPHSSTRLDWNMMSVAYRTVGGTSPVTRVDHSLVGTMANTAGYAQKAYFNPPPLMIEVGNVWAETWYAPTNITPAKVGQVGVYNNYVTWIERSDGHRTPDTGVYLRRESW